VQEVATDAVGDRRRARGQEVATDGVGVRRRVRLQDVAERAGVSKSIASRVVNRDPSVSVRAETRRRVLAVARDLSYRPDPVARALAGSVTGALALLVPSFDNQAYTSIIRGAYRRARERGFILLSAEDFDDQQADEAFTDLVEAGRIDGLLIASALPTGRLLAALRRHWVPHVFVNRSIPGEISNIVLDVAAASHVALNHLADLGHTRIGHIAGPAKVEAARRREDAFIAAAGERGLPPVAVQRSAFSEEAGLAAASRLLSRQPGVTAMYASSFVQAVGALHAARGLGLRVPEDLSLIAYEDAPLAGYLTPPLTTIAMPMAELGARAVDTLIGQVAGEPPHPEMIDSPPTLMLRDSTAPAPAR
jgi:DNA-binding LacI/PurR family transcriptional regulator